MKKILFLFLLAIIFCCEKESNATNQYMTAKYWDEFIGSKTDLPFIPDGNANYYSYGFLRKPGDKIGIRIKGQYGYARYISYNIYDNDTKASLGSLGDINILPDTNNQNPFTNLIQTKNRNYTVYFLPDIREASQFKNKLLYQDTSTSVSIFLRYYLAEITNSANVSLPTIEAFDMVTGKTLEIPTPLIADLSAYTDLINEFSNTIKIFTIVQPPNKVEFFRTSGGGLYENNDNAYLMAPVQLDNDEVVMFRFIPPTYAKNLSEISTSDVRYYSIGLGDSKTYNFVTKEDAKLKIGADGYINVVIGRKDDEIIAKANGLNFIEWVSEIGNTGLIVYRNLLTRPNYEYSLLKVPDIKENLNQPFSSYLYAKTHLGNHAPSGVKMTKQQFLQNFGNFPVSY